MSEHIYINSCNAYLEPDAIECPNCGTSMIPNYLHGVVGRGVEDKKVIVMCICTLSECKSPFLAKFTVTKSSSSATHGISRVCKGSEIHHYSNFETEPEEIEHYTNLVETRPYYSNFIDIYRQAHSAELSELHQIAGMGYRKALEFLVKEYAIYLNENDRSSIETDPLGKVIERSFKESVNLLDIAKRAAWLGNDHVHFIKKWVERDTQDLKRVILLTLQTIEYNESYKDFISEMDKPR